MVSTGLIFELWFSGFPHSMVSEFPCRADEHSGKTMMIIMVLRGVFQCKAEKGMYLGSVRGGIYLGQLDAGTSCKIIIS